MYIIRNILELTYDLKRLTVTSILFFIFNSILGNKRFRYMKFVFRLSFLN